jgi:hypothetical protein
MATQSLRNPPHTLAEKAARIVQDIQDARNTAFAATQGDEIRSVLERPAAE